jgi:hypothetical protein
MNWQDSDQMEIVDFKLSDSAKTLYQGCTELHDADVTWQTFKNAFSQRYNGVHSDQ